MRSIIVIARKSILYISTLVLAAGYPTAAMATTQEPVTDPAPAVTAPAEEAAPAEQQPLTYTYDPEAKKWNSEEWQWNAESQSYEKPPAPIIIEPETSEPTLTNSEPEAKSTDTQSTEKNIDTTVHVDNKIISDALSGNASITGNTTGGSALTGDAEAVATIVNAVNSSVSADENQKIATFTKDIVGDVKGDIILYPMLLKAMLEEESKNKSTAINVATNFDVNNDVALNAQSGNATVDSNTTAGDATTGSATAMANVVNILNSLIAMQDSFIGTINIYGSLEGDILIAPDFIPQMLASNGGSGSNSSTQLSTQDTTTIVNNISAVAQSGAASVLGNTTGGSASTGSADTNVVIFNVTGHDVVAENSMLVFVNVLGKWVGMIVDAPAGATAAMIGNGVTKNTQVAPDLTVSAQSTHGITNTIAVNAASGDAVVSNNTNAGSATSGNTKALADVANISGSQLSLTGWFGLLFINVMGDWFGSFQVNTAYGNAPQAPVPVVPAAGPVHFVPRQSSQNEQASMRRVFIDSRMVQSSPVVVASVQSGPERQPTEVTSEIKGATDEHEPTPAHRIESSHKNLWMIAGALFLMSISVLGLRRII